MKIRRSPVRRVRRAVVLVLINEYSVVICADEYTERRVREIVCLRAYAVRLVVFLTG